MDLVLIDYENPQRNIYEVTEEFYYHNGHYGTREDVVFLINGIPVLVIECWRYLRREIGRFAELLPDPAAAPL